jgi:hypothetical protein
MLSLGSTSSELGRQDGHPSSWRVSVGGHQLEQPGIAQLCQHGAGDLLPVVVPQHGSHARTMRGYVLWTHWTLRQYVDRGSFQDVMEKMFWVSLVDKFQILIILYFDI